MLSLLSTVALLPLAFAAASAPDSLTSKYCGVFSAKAADNFAQCVAINATFEDVAIAFRGTRDYATAHFRQFYTIDFYEFASRAALSPTSAPNVLELAGTHHGNLDFNELDNEQILGHTGNYSSSNALGALKAFDFGCSNLVIDTAGSYAGNCTVHLTARWTDLFGNNATHRFDLHYSPIGGTTEGSGPDGTDVSNATLKHVEFDQVARSFGIVPEYVQGYSFYTVAPNDPVSDRPTVDFDNMIFTRRVRKVGQY